MIWTLNMYFKHWFPYLLYVWIQCEYPGLTADSDARCPILFQSYGVSWFFRPRGLVYHSGREFLKYNLVLAFGYNFRNGKWYYLFSFTHFLLVFYISIFDIRRYNLVRIWVTHMSPVQWNLLRLKLVSAIFYQFYFYAKW